MNIDETIYFAVSVSKDVYSVVNLTTEEITLTLYDMALYKSAMTTITLGGNASSVLPFVKDGLYELEYVDSEGVTSTIEIRYFLEIQTEMLYSIRNFFADEHLIDFPAVVGGQQTPDLARYAQYSSIVLGLLTYHNLDATENLTGNYFLMLATKEYNQQLKESLSRHYREEYYDGKSWYATIGLRYTLSFYYAFHLEYELSTRDADDTAFINTKYYSDEVKAFMLRHNINYDKLLELMSVSETTISNLLSNQETMLSKLDDLSADHESLHDEHTTLLSDQVRLSEEHQQIMDTLADANTAPVIEIGGAPTGAIQLLETVTLFADGESNSLGLIAPDLSRIESYQWTFVGSVIDVTGADTDTVTFTSDVDGTVDVTLTVVSTNGLSTTVTNTVTFVELVAPTAVITGAPEYPETAVDVTLSAADSTSNSETHTITNYAWSVVGATSVSDLTSETVTFTRAASGLVLVELVVTSSNGVESSTTTANVDFSDTVPVVAVINGAITDPSVSTVVTLSGAMSTGPSDETLGYSWSVPGADNLSGEDTYLVSFTSFAQATLTATLTVSSGGNSYGTSSVEIRFIDASVSPVAIITNAPSTPNLGLSTVTLNGDTSTAPTGRTISEYLWSIPNGESIEGSTTDEVSFTSNTTGDIPVTLTVTDSLGSTHSSSTTVSFVSITDAGEAPVIAFSGDTTALVPDSVNYTASVSGYQLGTPTWSTSSVGATLVPASNGLTAVGSRTTAGSMILNVVVEDVFGRSDLYTHTTVWSGAGVPTADIAGGGVGTVVSTINLDASGSTFYPSNTSESYSWAVTSGTGTVTPSIDGVTATLTTNSVGTVVVTLTVTDDRGQTDTATHTVVFSMPTSPTATITGVTEGFTGANVLLDASSSTFYNGNTTETFTWSVTSGIGTIQTSSGGSVATLTTASTGDVTVTLVATDSLGQTDTDTHTVTFTDQIVIVPPVATITGDEGATTGETITLSATTSTFYTGNTSESYSWSLTSGTGTLTPASNGKTATITASTQGTNIVSLTITDDQSQTSTDTHSITFLDLPVADIKGDTTSETGVNVLLNGDDSTFYVGNTTEEYLWSVVSGTATIIGASVNDQATIYTNTAGTVVVSLTVTDESEQTDTTNHTITFLDITDPVAVITGSTSAFTGESRTLTTDSSTLDSDATYTYAWSIASGESLLTPTNTDTAVFRSTLVGTYVVNLTITDDFGNSSTDTHSITVNSPEPPPTAYITDPSNGNSVSVNTAAALSGQSSVFYNGNTTDVYLWEVISGSARLSASDHIGCLVTSSITSSQTVTIRLTVTDSYGSTGTATTTISFAAASGPTAVITGDQTGDPTTGVVLAGDTSTTGSGTTTYTWMDISGTDGAILSAINAASNIELTADEAGAYNVSLTVTNGGFSSSASYLVNLL